MAQEQMNTAIMQATPRPPGFFRRLWRAFIRTVVTLIVVTLLGAAAWVGLGELRRSFTVVSDRIGRQEVRVLQLEGELITLQAQLNDAQDRQDDLQAQLETQQRQDDDFTSQFGQLETVYAGEQTQQNEILTGLQQKLGDVEMQTLTITGQIAALNTIQVALQGDITGNGSQIDILGGDLDTVRLALATLQEQGVILSASVVTMEGIMNGANVPAMRQTVNLFRLWELVARARLRLLENNFGLAMADVSTAIAAMPHLRASSEEKMLAPLQQIEQRLLLAFSNLPDNPQLAAGDLEAVWQELDVLVAAAAGFPAVETDGAAGTTGVSTVPLTTSTTLTPTATTP